MGVYTEYVDQHLDPTALKVERAVQLRRISAARGGRDILVYAAGTASQEIEASDCF